MIIVIVMICISELLLSVYEFSCVSCGYGYWSEKGYPYLECTVVDIESEGVSRRLSEVLWLCVLRRGC